MKIGTSLLLILALALLPGCAGTTRVLTDTVAAGVGGYAGSKLGKGDPLITAAGASAGVLLGEALNYANDNHAKKAYAEGFNKGRSDAVKQQYWILIRQQQQPKTPLENVSLYAIPVPEQTIDGTILNPTTKYLRIQN